MGQIFDIDQLRQEWSTADHLEANNIDWASTEEISRVVTHYKAQRRRHATRIVMSVSMVVGISFLFTIFNFDNGKIGRVMDLRISESSPLQILNNAEVLTNQPNMDPNMVASIMDEAWESFEF